MDRILKMGVCLTLIVVLSCPAIVLAKDSSTSAASNMATTVYDGGAKVLNSICPPCVAEVCSICGIMPQDRKGNQRTEGIINRCLKSTFSLFNPCLDAVKMCTDVALKPLNYPFDYVEQKIDKPKVVNKRVEIPAPQKPVMPKQ